jgi:hypothetical protein
MTTSTNYGSTGKEVYVLARKIAETLLAMRDDGINRTDYLIKLAPDLMAALEDVSDSEDAIAAIRGEGEYLPFEITERLMGGDNPLK